MPSSPFSDCSSTSRRPSAWLASSVGSPIPRLMFMPSASSRAARVTIRARASSGERSRAATSALPHGEPLDPLLVTRSLEDPLDEDARRVNLVGIELAHLDELLDLGDRDLPRHRRERVEVPRGIAVDEVAERVA